MNMKYYQREFQNEAMRWWGTLSINQMKEFEQKHGIRWRMAYRSEIAAIYDTEILHSC